MQQRTAHQAESLCDKFIQSTPMFLLTTGWLKMRLQLQTLQLSPSWSLLFNTTFLLLRKKMGTGQVFRHFLACVHVGCLTAVASVQLSTTTCCFAVHDRPCMWQGALRSFCSKIFLYLKWKIYLGRYSNSQTCPTYNAGVPKYGSIP